MAEQHEFETALERRLQARASMAARPFDASAIAGAAVVAHAPRRLALPWTFRGIAWGWVAVMLATLAIVGGMLLAGALLRDPYQGPWLAVTRADGLYLAHEDGTQARRIFESGDRLIGLRWSADGSLLSFFDPGPETENGTPGRLLVLDPQGGVVRSLDGVNEGEWSHTGHRLAWTAWGSTRGGLMIMDVDTGATTAIAETDAQSLIQPSWSPDDTRIAVAAGSANPTMIRVVAVDGGPDTLTLSDASAELSNPTWSPDGRFIAVMSVRYAPPESTCPDDTGRCPSTIRVFDAVSGALEGQLRDQDLTFSALWSPDGRQLAWSATDRQAERQDIYIGTLPLATVTVVQVTAWSGSTWVLGWTNDGTSLLAGHMVGPEDGTGREPVELWRVPLDPAGGDPVLLRADVFNAALQPTR